MGLLPSILGLSLLSASQGLTHYHPQHLCSPISYTLTSFLSVCPGPTHPLRSNRSPTSSKNSPQSGVPRACFMEHSPDIEWSSTLHHYCISHEFARFRGVAPEAEQF